MISIENLLFEYNTKKILNNITANIGKGKLSGLLGPNGSGKSTLFKLCLNFLEAEQGNILINNINIKKLTPTKMSKLIAYVPQEHRFSFPFKVYEIVLMGRSPYMNGIFGISKEDIDVVYSAMELLNITYLADLPVTQLSGGQKQLVLIARAIAQNTPIIILDEPTSALDFNHQLLTWKILKDISKKGVTILASSHDPNYILWFCDEAILINKGSIISCGNTEDVITDKNLSKIYKDDYIITNIDNRKFIMPLID